MSAATRQLIPKLCRNHITITKNRLISVLPTNSRTKNYCFIDMKDFKSFGKFPQSTTTGIYKNRSSSFVLPLRHKRVFAEKKKNPSENIDISKSPLPQRSLTTLENTMLKDTLYSKKSLSIIENSENMCNNISSVKLSLSDPPHYGTFDDDDDYCYYDDEDERSRCKPSYSTSSTSDSFDSSPLPSRRGKLHQRSRASNFSSLIPLVSRPRLRHVVLLEKMTRWEAFCKEAKNSKEILKMRNLFPGMFETYISHTVAIEHILHLLKNVHGLRVRHLKAQTVNSISLEGIDAVIAAGGDGTFLEAASLVQIAQKKALLLNSSNKKKNDDIEQQHLPRFVNKRISENIPNINYHNHCPIWVFGINTDPNRSEGNLLMKPALDQPKHSQRKSLSCVNRRRFDTPTDALKLSKELEDSQNCTKSYETSSTASLASSSSFIDDYYNVSSSRKKRTTTCHRLFPMPSDSIDQVHHQTLEGIRYVVDQIIKGDYIPIQRRRIRVTLIDPESPILDGSISNLKFPTKIPTTTFNNCDTHGNYQKLKNCSDIELQVSSSTPIQTHSLKENINNDTSLEMKSNESMLNATSPCNTGLNRRSIKTPLENNAVGGNLKKLDEEVDDDYFSSFTNKAEPKQLTLGYLAVNDVLITSRKSHTTFYVEWSVDGSKPQRSKNSGIIVSTGSGSTAWAYNVSKISQSTVDNIIKHFLDQQPGHLRNALTPVNSQEIASAVNASLLFSPSEPKMRLVVREPIDNRVFATKQSSIEGRKISLRPLTDDTIICSDGISAVPVRFGQTIVLEIDHDEDLLWTAI